MASHAKEDSFPIFIIGMQRTATTSFHCWLERLGVSSCHLSILDDAPDGLLQQVEKGQPLSHRAWSDMVFLHSDELFEQSKRLVTAAARNYADAKFVLNVRDPQEWVRAHFMLFAWFGVKRTELELKTVMQRWYEWHAFVMDVFSDQPDRLVVFDIKKDDIATVGTFLGFSEIDSREKWTVTNTTQPKDIEGTIPPSQWWNFQTRYDEQKCVANH